MQERRRHVVAIADASFCGMGRHHSMAGIIEQQPCQQVVGFVAYDGPVGPLGKGSDLNRTTSLSLCTKIPAISAGTLSELMPYSGFCAAVIRDPVRAAAILD